MLNVELIGFLVVEKISYGWWINLWVNNWDVEELKDYV